MPSRLNENGDVDAVAFSDFLECFTQYPPEPTTGAPNFPTAAAAAPPYGEAADDDSSSALSKMNSARRAAGMQPYLASSSLSALGKRLGHLRQMRAGLDMERLIHGDGTNGSRSPHRSRSPGGPRYGYEQRHPEDLEVRLMPLTLPLSLPHPIARPHGAVLSPVSARILYTHTRAHVLIPLGDDDRPSSRYRRRM